MTMIRMHLVRLEYQQLSKVEEMTSSMIIQDQELMNRIRMLSENNLQTSNSEAAKDKIL
jgi:hypothetical protein